MGPFQLGMLFDLKSDTIKKNLLLGVRQYYSLEALPWVSGWKEVVAPW